MISIQNVGEKEPFLLENIPESLPTVEIVEVKKKFPERKLENWLLSFRDWAIPRTDAPEAFIFWAGIFTIAAALEKRVKIPKSILASWECYPHMYMMFVGPPGMRKTTSMMSFANPLLTKATNLVPGPTFFTKEALVNQLIQAKNNSLYLLVGEFSDIIQKGKPSEIFDFLTSMYDDKEKLEVNTMMRGMEVGGKPCLNFFAASTPGWISQNMGDSFMSGGLASRFIFAYADKLRNPKLIYKKMMLDFKESEQAKLLEEDLKTITLLQGEFDITDEIEDVLNHWITGHAETSPSDKRMLGYHSRKPMMILKLAMIYSVAVRNELIIDMEAFNFGKFAVESTEGELHKVFSGVGKNEFIFDMNAITGYIHQEERVSHDQLLSTFRSAAEPRKLQELIAGLVAMGDIKVEVGKDKIFYTIPS